MPITSFLWMQCNVKKIVNENTCFKNALNPSCIYIFITNSPLRFQNKKAIPNWIFDFHKMAIKVIKITFKKQYGLQKDTIERIIPHTWQKPWEKLLCVDFNLRQNVSKLKLKPISNYTESRKSSVVGRQNKKILWVIRWEKPFRQ